MRDRDFTRVAEILPQILKKIGLKSKIEEQEILSLWTGVVGQDIASRTRAVKFDRHVLHVHVDHGAWMQELRFMEKELIRKMKEKAPGIDLKKIRFRGMKHR